LPVVGRTPEQAAANHRDAFNALLHATVTRAPLVMVKVARSGGVSPDYLFEFRQGVEPSSVPLRTRFGTVGLFVGQRCAVVEEKRRHRLYTLAYRYTLTPAGAAEPLLRWEYVRTPVSGSKACRHHLQGTPTLALGKHSVTLNALHLPTGFVTLEEVLRFCVVDLKVKPLARDWSERLEASYRSFTADEER
jgi:hypothetical protein